MSWNFQLSYDLHIAGYSARSGGLEKRRSNITTGAQWIETRFGNGQGGKLSHGVVVVFAIIGALGFLAYGFINEVNKQIKSDQCSLFTIVFMLMIFKGILGSSAGPAPNYDMQKTLATRSPREASLMSFFVNIVLMPTRYLMIARFVVMGVILSPRIHHTISECPDRS